MIGGAYYETEAQHLSDSVVVWFANSIHNIIASRILLDVFELVLVGS